MPDVLAYIERNRSIGHPNNHICLLFMPQESLDLEFLLQQKQKLAGETRDLDSGETESERVLRPPEPMPDEDLILSDSDSSGSGPRVIEVDDDLDELAELCNKEFEPDKEFSVDEDLNLDDEPLILPAEPEPTSDLDDAFLRQAPDEQDDPDAELSDEPDVHLIFDSETEGELRFLMDDLDDEIGAVFLREDEEQSGEQVAESEIEDANVELSGFDFAGPADAEPEETHEQPQETGAATVPQTAAGSDPLRLTAFDESEQGPVETGQPQEWASEASSSTPAPQLDDQGLDADEALESPALGPPSSPQMARSPGMSEPEPGQDRSVPGGLSEQMPGEASEPKSQAPGKLAFSFASLFENSRLLGIDLGSSSVKYVELEKGARGLNLANCGQFALPEVEAGEDQAADADPTAAVVAERLNLKQFKDDLVTSAISGMEVIFKNIKVPKMPQKELRKAVPWACRKELPFPLEKTAFEFRSLDGAQGEDGKLAVFVIAAQKELIRQHLQKLGAARITPAKVATIPSALWHLFRACAGRDTDGCHCLVDIGAQSSHIVFINGGELQFAREISTASQDFTQALTGTIFVEGDEITLSADQAEKLKRNHGIPGEMNQFDIVDGVPLIEVSAMIGGVLERLTNDIHRTMGFYKERFKTDPVTKIYLTGGGALMPNLPEKLSQELQAEVIVLNPFDSISLRNLDRADELRKFGPKFAVAVGLALDKQKSLNLLPRELKRSHAARYAKKIFRYVFVIAMLAMVFLSQGIALRVNRVRVELQRVMAEYQQNAPNRQRFEKLQQDLRYLEQLKNQQGPVHEVDFSAARHLKLVSQLFPSHMTLTSLRYAHQQRKSAGAAKPAVIPILILDGVAFPNRSMEGMNLANFLLSLKQSAEFQLVSLTSQTVREDGGLQFTIECEVEP